MRNRRPSNAILEGLIFLFTMMTCLYLTFVVLCSAGKFQRGVYSQIYFDVSPGNGRQASSENRIQGGKPTLSSGGFLPEPLFLLPDSHALRIPNTTISLLYPTYKAHRKKSEEF